MITINNQENSIPKINDSCAIGSKIYLKGGKMLKYSEETSVLEIFSQNITFLLLNMAKIIRNKSQIIKTIVIKLKNLFFLKKAFITIIIFLIIVV